MPETDFSEIRDLIEAIPGEACGGGQPEFLYRLSLQTVGWGDVVEIGTNAGRSAIALAYGQKVKGGGPIYSIDLYEHPDIRRNLERAGVQEYVKRVVLPSHRAARGWDRPVELLWIDGDHTWRGVSSDITQWAHLLQPGGVIAFHDYPGHDRSCEVSKALRKHVFSDPARYRVLSDREAGSIIAFQRLAEAGRDSVGKRLSRRVYWHYRNARTVLVRLSPGLAGRAARAFGQRTGGKP